MMKYLLNFSIILLLTTETFKIIKVTFRGQHATTPVIDNISKNYNVTTNLLYGTITDIKGLPLGILTLKISGDESSINKALQQIKQKAYSVEIITRSNRP